MFGGRGKGNGDDIAAMVTFAYAAICLGLVALFNQMAVRLVRCN